MKLHFFMMISEAPLVYTRKPPESSGTMVLMFFLALLKVYTFLNLVSGISFLS